MGLVRTIAVAAALACPPPATGAAGFLPLGQIDDQPSVSFGEMAWRSGGDTVHHRDSRSRAQRTFASSCFVYDVDDGRAGLALS